MRLLPAESLVALHQLLFGGSSKESHCAQSKNDFQSYAELVNGEVFKGENCLLSTDRELTLIFEKDHGFLATYT